MSDQFLHGVEVIELTTGTRPIQTVRSSIIGLVGTAPAAAAAIAATLILGAGNAGLAFAAKAAGTGGNQISVALNLPAQNNAVLAVTVSGKAIAVALSTNASGVATSTAAQVKAAIEAFATAHALIAVTYPSGGTGSGAALVSPALALTGGVDEPFPLNVPVLIAGNQMEAAGLGSTGTLPPAIDDIFDQAGAMIIVVRVAAAGTEAAELANVIGGVGVSGNYEGVKALLSAQSILGITPRILICPGYSHNAALVTEMVSIATKLRAIIVADGPNTTDAAAIAQRNLFGSDRVYLVDPWVKVFDVASATEVIRPASGRVAGLIAKSDAERGYWHSPSNRLIEGITGTARPVEFALGDATSRANYLNENEVATIIQAEGFRLWGNRSCSNDPKMAFLKRRRIADMISESIQAAHMWAVDRNIDRTYIEEVIEGVNAYARSLMARGALVGFKCWAPPALNKPLELEAGKVTFDFDWSDPATAEHITFRSVINNGYLAEVLPTAA